jgi:short-subunit dehydrogenase
MQPRPLALVTGASSGIGEVFARALAARSFDLVLVARRKDRLDALHEQLRERHGATCHVVAADLAKPTGVDDAVAVVEQLARPVDLLVNNAGFGSYGPFAALPPERELEMIDLNVRALVALTGHFLPSMVSRRAGSVLNVASTTSFQPVPYMAVYGATKAFVLHFSEAVASEVRGSGVRVLAVCPGHTPTEFQHTSGVHARPARTPSQSAEEVVREALAALDAGSDDVVVTGLPNKLTTRLPRLLPRRAMTWIVERGFRPRGGRTAGT